MWYIFAGIVKIRFMDLLDNDNWAVKTIDLSSFGGKKFLAKVNGGFCKKNGGTKVSTDIDVRKELVEERTDVLMYYNECFAME